MWVSCREPFWAGCVCDHPGLMPSASGSSEHWALKFYNITTQNTEDEDVQKAQMFLSPLSCTCQPISQSMHDGAPSHPSRGTNMHAHVHTHIQNLASHTEGLSAVLIASTHVCRLVCLHISVSHFLLYVVPCFKTQCGQI